MVKKFAGIILLGVIAIFILVQFVPRGRNHTNPAVVQEPAWDKPETRVLAQRACFDCHSNETIWPWYSSVAPFSWLIGQDVEEGRERLNFSAWGRGEQEIEEIADVIQNGEMPPVYYVILHPEANLSNQERLDLLNGLIGSLGVAR